MELEMETRRLMLRPLVGIEVGTTQEDKIALMLEFGPASDGSPAGTLAVGMSRDEASELARRLAEAATAAHGSTPPTASVN